MPMGGTDGFRPAAWVRAAARVGQLAEERAGLSLGRVDEQQVRRRASRRLGRPVVGDDPGLNVLLADAAKAPLTFPFDRGKVALGPLDLGLDAFWPGRETVHGVASTHG